MLIMRNFLNNFLRGLLLLVPMAAAMYVVWYLYNCLDGLIQIATNIPGLSFFILATSTVSFVTAYSLKPK